MSEVYDVPEKELKTQVGKLTDWVWEQKEGFTKVALINKSIEINKPTTLKEFTIALDMAITIATRS